jgi:hypothetical protein
MLKKDYSVVVKKHCVFPMFFNNHLYQPSVFRNLFLKSGIKSTTGKNRIQDIFEQGHVKINPKPVE